MASEVTVTLCCNKICVKLTVQREASLIVSSLVGMATPAIL